MTGYTGDCGQNSNLSDLDYDLPDALIAQHPLPRRDDSRLLVLKRASAELCDSEIALLPEWLQSGDLLVVNDTKVLPAKFTALRKTGGKVRGLFIREEDSNTWRVLLESSGRIRAGEKLIVAGRGSSGVNMHLLQACGAGEWLVRVDSEGTAQQILDRIGLPPLPPYIRRAESDPETECEDRSRYQTVYAARPGAIAAPTAGLHLTPAILERLRSRGVEITSVTLHVGVGTFKPIHVHDISQHVMHAEWYELNPETTDAVRRCRLRAGRVVAVGTTTVRVLEACAEGDVETRTVRSSSGTTDIFIRPPYRFRVVDALLTNFHLPRSTLLALVMALAGVAEIRRAYRHAIERQYRFYSYGDAMLIL